MLTYSIEREIKRINRLKVASVKQVSYTEIAVCGNQSIIGVIAPSSKYEEFIHLKIVDEIENIISPACGSAQQHINKDILNKYVITIPDDNIILKFKEVVSPYYQAISDTYSVLNFCQ
ncbi:MAG: hypothetical protein HDS84_04405 [Bacteroidales bacterium]|nr:hypothetical protein [Bacteroidales bacterium]MBD5205599.1 hypothetical protein [Bacteroidales bacterium]MBD5302995.1 hypothetical protein [Bacteroides sp.]